MRGKAGTAWEKLTQILNVLICGQGNNAALLSSPQASTVCLVDDNAVCDAGREEGHPIRKRCPFRVVVEGNVRQAVAESCKQQRNMPGEPSELQCLREGRETLAQRQGGRWWRGHGGDLGNSKAVVWAT